MTSRKKSYPTYKAGGMHIQHLIRKWLSMIISDKPHNYIFIDYHSGYEITKHPLVINAEFNNDEMQKIFKKEFSDSGRVNIGLSHFWNYIASQKIFINFWTHPEFGLVKSIDSLDKFKNWILIHGVSGNY